jgi:cytochrome c oxidase subunit II
MMALGFSKSLAATGLIALLLCGCSDIQSVLTPQSSETRRIIVLFWVLTIGASAILIAVVMLTGAAITGRPAWRAALARDAVVLGGGLVFPAVTLTALLAYGFHVMRADPSASAPGPPLSIAVVGEQWWWRVIYMDSGGRRFESANELRIPVNRRVEIALSSADVIHSFWVPKLAGKLDMIPGRTTTLHVSADEPGVSRGQCAEYCGGAHALMSFHVVAMAEREFEAWLAREAMAAVPPREDQEAEGRALFLESGCGGCHSVRGTEAAGTIGPDLTHVGSRLSLAAATLPNDAAAYARWIRDNQHIKPENRMPPFGIFSETELAALSRYLASLK